MAKLKEEFRYFTNRVLVREDGPVFSMFLPQTILTLNDSDLPTYVGLLPTSNIYVRVQNGAVVMYYTDIYHLSNKYLA